MFRLVLKKNCNWQILQSRHLVHSFVFSVEKIDVHLLSYFSENFICILYMFKDGYLHVINAVSSTVEMLACCHCEVLVPHIALMFCKPVFESSGSLTNILHETFPTGDQFTIYISLFCLCEITLFFRVEII